MLQKQALIYVISTTMASFMVRKKEENREELFTRLYLQAFPQTAAYVHKMGGNAEEARDVFQDALVIYYEKVVCGELTLRYSAKSYLLGVVKNLWKHQYAARSRYRSVFCQQDEELPEIHDHVYTEISASGLLQLLSTAGRKCMELLRAAYYENLGAAGLAERFGYGSTHSATVQKYKCLEKVKETVKEKSLTYADFTE